MVTSILIIVMIICSYLLGYAKKGLDISDALVKVCDDLKTELDKYTDETFDETACAFFKGALWILDWLRFYEEDLFDAEN